MNRKLLTTCIAVGFFCSASAETSWQLGADEQVALQRISAQSMRGHLSFLASDALEGRGTPSRGLDMAAEYIAAQFRRAGLEPVQPKGSYFQPADFLNISPKLDDARVTVRVGVEEITVDKADLRVTSTVPVDVTGSETVRLPNDNVTGKVVFGDAQAYSRRDQLAKLRAQKPSLIVLVSNRGTARMPATQFQPVETLADVPVVALFGAKAFSAWKAREPVTVSVHIAAPDVTHVFPRNVAGILRGSDPLLRDQYIILSAHYDHLGLRSEGPDRIFNGANDNGSGTVSVIETAAALASMPNHPKRSILFLTVFGEEKGLFGALYYTKHPLVPLAKTILNINLEQMGRTDEQDGKQVSSFGFTGPSFSSVPELMEGAAKPLGVHIYHKQNADSFFSRSDNYAFAQAGIVDHTIAVAFEFPDYHAVGDEWEKVDYANMEKVDRAVAAGLLRLANMAEAPQWKVVPETEEYRKAKVQ